MTRPLSTLIIAAAAPVLAGVLFFAAPMLRSDAAVLNVEVHEHVERARRLLLAFGENQERLAELLGHLNGAGVDTELGGDAAERIIEDNRDVVDDATDVLKRRTRGPAATRINEVEQRYAELGGTGSTPLVAPGGLGGNISAIIKSVRQGIRERDRILAENRALLDEALKEADSAIAASRGEANGSEHGHANRIKGIILSAQAASLHREALRTRERSNVYRSALAAAMAEVGRLTIDRELVGRSTVLDRLDALREETERVRRVIETRKADIARLQSTIGDLEGRIEGLRDDARTMRAEMETLEEEGADLLDPRGAASFAEHYSALSRDYRSAVAEAHRLEHGTLTGARIDDSGDYVRGAFVPDVPGGEIARQRGLVDYQHDLATAVSDRAGDRETLAGLEERIRDLSALAEDYTRRASDATTRLAEVRARGAETYAAFEKLVQEADALFEQADRKARAAVQVFRVSGGSVSARASAARDRIDGLSPASRDRSPFKPVSEDRWPAGQLNNETGQARFLLGSIRFARYAAAAADHALASSAKAELELPEADPAVFAERRDAAREAGIEALRAAAADFERSFRNLGNNWTVPAEAAAAHYLLSLLEHPGHIRTAIENYQKAADNIPDNPTTQRIIDRLEQLSSR